MFRRAFVPLVVVLSLASGASAQVSVEAEFSRDAIGVKSYPGAPRLAERAGIAPAVVVPAATEAAADRILEMQQWNDAGKLPFRNGFTRALGDPVSVRLEGALAAKTGAVASHARGLVSTTERGTLVWSGSVRVDGAHRVRLHLSNVHLPEGAVLWVYGKDQQPVGFDRDLLHDGSLYAPSVSGPLVHLEIEIPFPKRPMDVASFEIRDFVELFPAASLRSLDPVRNAPDCLVNAACVSAGTFEAIAVARAAGALIYFVSGGDGAVCSGGLMNDTVPSTFVPYFLTANHCVDDQATASTVEAYFDYRAACGTSTYPPFPTSHNGATLLATSANTDFTLLRLNSVPEGRGFLPWTTASPVSGMKLHRLSHPFPYEVPKPYPQAYSSTIVSTALPSCDGLPSSTFLYSNLGDGGTYPGSSGSPVMLTSGVVVGQLYGGCGPTSEDGCDSINNSTVDGRFAVSYPFMAAYLNPIIDACAPNATTLCLSDDRFKVQATWQSTSSSGTANVVELTPDTGYLWFFSSTNVEAMVKIINGCGLNSRYWVFAAGLTDTRVQITVTDTKTGSVKTYTNPLGTAFAPIQDTSAFATCP